MPTWIIKVAVFESRERLRSSEIKEDGLRFVDDHPKSLVLKAKNGYVARKLKAYVSLTIINPEVACFEIKERLRSSEIKEDGQTNV